MDTHGGELDLLGIAWRLGATFFFVGLNGFFVATEFALVKVRSSRIQELSKRGHHAAGRVGHILNHLDLYLSACQLGITLASLALGALGEPAVSRLLLAAAGAAGITIDEQSRLVPIISITIAFAIITILHMTVGEQAPKMWALRRAESTALSTSFALRVFTLVFRPFIAMINSISNWMLRMVGLKKGGHGAESVLTVEELRSILTLSASAGHISEQGLSITSNVFRLVELEVRHIMVPRVDVGYLSLRNEIDENLHFIRHSSNSRFPLCETDLDSVIGFVHGKDVLEALISKQTVDLRSLSREPVFVPDTMSISNLLLEMQVRRVHMAVVIDEHGTVIGLAFREDALEEIVGPLGDEFDDEAPALEEIGEGMWEVRGNMPIPDLCNRLGVVVDDEGEETAAGYMIAHLGRLPKAGDTVEFGPFKLVATEFDRRRIKKIRITKPEENAPSPPGAITDPPVR